MDILRIYTDPADRTRVMQEIERNGSVQDYTVKTRKKDGTRIDCLISSTCGWTKTARYLATRASSGM